MAIKNPHKGDKFTKAVLAGAKSICLLGMGGIGMYSVGRQLLERGYLVVGADRTPNSLTDDLVRRGAVFFGAEAPPIPAMAAADAFVYTAALDAQHPALVYAAAHGKPILSRADALAFLMMDARPRVAVCGSHGKSTTTAMCAHILARCGLAPTMVCGADTENDGTCYLSGSGAYVFEACEYMHSFLSFTPEISVVTNLDHDHADCYPTMASVVDAFARFLSQSGAALLSADCKHSAALAGKAPQTYWFSLNDRLADAFLSADNQLYWQGMALGTLPLSLPGECNRANALAACAAALACGADAASLMQAVREEKGVKRRLSFKGRCNGALCYDDYAHHPTEIAAAICAVRPLVRGRLYCVFQSHTYTRAAACLSEIAHALQGADKVIVADIYPARETDTLGMSASVIACAVGDKATAISSFSHIAQHLKQNCTAGDVVLIMGAGDIFRVFDFMAL